MKFIDWFRFGYVDGKVRMSQEEVDDDVKFFAHNERGPINLRLVTDRDLRNDGTNF